MATEITVDGTAFRINGELTYAGRSWQGHAIEGLLFNSRMIQAIFDDENPETAVNWRYPDTGIWDPQRNTDDFCAMLPEYRRHGLLAVTVGLQGGGSIYTQPLYDSYECSAFAPDGTLREPYFARLRQVLAAADAAGMVVIVNYFYWKHLRRLTPAAVERAAAATTSWLLASGYRNILVDIINEAGAWQKLETTSGDFCVRLLEIVQGTTLAGRRLICGISSGGGMDIATGRWADLEDISLPHGNGLQPAELEAKIRAFRESDAWRRRPRPILINEDSIFVENLEAAVRNGASWGFYCQGYGSVYQDRMNWKTHGRETTVDALSGFQTLPVNWRINTDIKRAFFDRLKTITGGG